MKKILILILVFLTNIFSIKAQDIKNGLHIESIDHNGVITEVDGHFFSLSIVKAETLYQVIIIDKNRVIDSKEFKVYLNQEQGTEPYIFTIQADSKDIIKSDKLVAIPFILIRAHIHNNNNNNNNVIYPTSTLEDFIPEIMTGITEKDVDNLKQVMEKWIYP